MNSTHAYAAGGGTVFGAALTSVLSGTFQIEPALAADWVSVGAGIAGFLIAMAAWWLKWKYPDAPPLPDLSARTDAALADERARATGERLIGGEALSEGHGGN